MSPNQTLECADNSTDYLTCGGCAQEFPLQKITDFILHKKVGCLDTSELDQAGSSGLEGPELKALQCFSCCRDFMTARGLLHHIQLYHNIKIFNQPGDKQAQTDRLTEVSELDGDNTPVQSSNTWITQTSANEDSLNAVEKTGSDVDSIAHDNGCAQDGRCGLGDNCQEKSGHCKKSVFARGNTICCNRQECCVTIIPGTHERPKKCCSAVVPKKRKQHMAEHMSCHSMDLESSDHESSDREYDQNEDNGTEDSNSNSIYIDFHPRSRHFGDRFPKYEENDNRDVNVNASFNISHSVSKENENFDESGIQEVMEPGSVIMHPGKTYSIPVSYAYSESDLTILNNRSSKTFPQTFNEFEHTTSISIETSSVSSFCDERTFKSPMCRQQNSSETSVTLSQDSPISTPREVESTSSYIVSSHEGELGDSDKDDEMEIDDTMHDRRKRRYPTSRPFKCNECDNAFNQRIHLKKHMSKHTGVKPFKCAQCSYSTVERSHLKVHFRIHTGEKPFKCTYCKYATAQNSTLKIHLKRHHNGKMLECQDCSKTFTQHEMLTSHRTGHQPSGLTNQPISAPVLAVDDNEPLNLANQWKALPNEPISSGQQSALGANQLQEMYEITNQNIVYPVMLKNINSDQENG